MPWIRAVNAINVLNVFCSCCTVIKPSAPAFLKSLSCHQSMWVCVCVCVRVRAYPPRPYITSGVILTLNDWLNNFGCSSVLFYGSFHQCHQ